MRNPLLFLAPHCDDEALFGAFTLLRHRPHVLICVNTPKREAETRAAMEILGCTWESFRLPLDELPYWLEERKPTHVWAPSPEVGGNPDHNFVGRMAERMFPGRLTRYMTYTPAGKSAGIPVPYELDWIGLKLRALACYPSQYGHPSHAPHFVRGLEEFYAS
jgi:LmbE family N-acetylglucosaminyl deacetylase